MDIDRLANILTRTSDERDYVKDLAAWQIEHDTNRKDMTPAQDTRLRLYTRCADLGIEPSRVAFAQYLVSEGFVSDGD